MSKPKEVEFEPGWLEKQIEDNEVSLALSHDPQFYIRFIGSTTLPLPKKQADELYRRMNARFEAWTGRSLREWKSDDAT